MASEAVYTDDAHVHHFTRESASVTPARAVTDASRLTFPWQMTVGMITFALAIGGFMWRIDTSVQVMAAKQEARERADLERLQTDREIKELEKRYLEQRFAALEAKIESAGLRNAALTMSRELDAKGKK